jgi:hypothetical protein
MTRLYSRSLLTDQFKTCKAETYKVAYSNWVEEDWFSKGQYENYKRCENVNLCRLGGQPEQVSCLSDRSNNIPFPFVFPSEPNKRRDMRGGIIGGDNRTYQERLNNCATSKTVRICNAQITGCDSCPPKLQARYDAHFRGVFGEMSVNHGWGWRPVGSMYVQGYDTLIQLSPMLGTNKLLFNRSGGSGNSYAKLTVTYTSRKNMQLVSPTAGVQAGLYPIDITKIDPIETKLTATLRMNALNLLITQSDIDTTKQPYATQLLRWNGRKWSVPIYQITTEGEAPWSSSNFDYIDCAFSLQASLKQPPRGRYGRRRVPGDSARAVVWAERAR